MVNNFYTLEDAKKRVIKHWRATCSGVCGDHLQRIKTALEALPENPTVKQVEAATGSRVYNTCIMCGDDVDEVVQIYSDIKGLMCICESCVDEAANAFRENAAHVGE